MANTQIGKSVREFEFPKYLSYIKIKSYGKSNIRIR